MTIELVVLCIIQFLAWSFLTVCCFISRISEKHKNNIEPLPQYTLDLPPNYDIIHPPPCYI